MKKVPRIFDFVRRKSNRTRAFRGILPSQSRAQQSTPALELYKISCGMLHENLLDIKRQFTNMAVVGPCVHYLLDMMEQTPSLAASLKRITVCDISESSLAYTQHCLASSRLADRISYQLLEWERWKFPPSHFDVIVSSLHFHQQNNLEETISDMLHSLIPDGAIIGNTLGKKTLDELRICYVLAESERYGGLSPHVSPFIDIADFGNIMGHCKVAIPSIFNHEYQVLFDSPIELMTAIQSIGENSTLVGSRKGVYKDLLMAVVALYANLFSVKVDNSDKIMATVELVNFVGWKESETQRKPLKRGSQDVHLGELIKELQEEDSSVEYGSIEEDNPTPLVITKPKAPQNPPPDTNSRS